MSVISGGLVPPDQALFAFIGAETKSYKTSPSFSSSPKVISSETRTAGTHKAGPVPLCFYRGLCRGKTESLQGDIMWGGLQLHALRASIVPDCDPQPHVLSMSLSSHRFLSSWEGAGGAQNSREQVRSGPLSIIGLFLGCLPSPLSSVLRALPGHCALYSTEIDSLCHWGSVFWRWNFGGIRVLRMSSLRFW